MAAMMTTPGISEGKPAMDFYQQLKLVSTDLLESVARSVMDQWDQIGSIQLERCHEVLWLCNMLYMKGLDDASQNDGELNLIKTFHTDHLFHFDNLQNAEAFLAFLLWVVKWKENGCKTKKCVIRYDDANSELVAMDVFDQDPPNAEDLKDWLGKI